MAASFVLDTDVCIDLIRGHLPAEGSDAGGVPLAASAISSITLAELEVGVVKAPVPTRSRRQLDEFVGQVTVVAFDTAAAHQYGAIRAHLEKQDTTIGPLDLLIAAHALSRGARLVTANLREFRRVPGLTCVRWDRVTARKRRR